GRTKEDRPVCARWKSPLNGRRHAHWQPAGKARSPVLAVGSYRGPSRRRRSRDPGHKPGPPQPFSFVATKIGLRSSLSYNSRINSPAPAASAWRGLAPCADWSYLSPRSHESILGHAFYSALLPTGEPAGTET